MSGVKVEKVEYGGWRNCYRVTNGVVELVVTSDVGPRILRYGFVDGRNLFKEFTDQLGGSGESSFQSRGGHRLWKAPEDLATSWAADNGPVEIRVTEHGVVALAPVEPQSGLRKTIEASMAETGSDVVVTHRIENCSGKDQRFAPWAITVMATGGVAVAGFPPRGTHPECLTPTNPLTMWAFTDLSDPRWTLLRKYLVLRQDTSRSAPQKIGLFAEHTWGAYLLDGEVFLKETRNDASQTYSDFGCSFETFTNDEFLEMETLGPLRTVAPGEHVEHVERWSLHRGVHVREWSDAGIDAGLAAVLSSRA